MSRTADATSLEASLWFVAHCSADATALNVTRAYEVSGATPMAIETALRTLVRRHESLRTGFEARVDGTVARHVHGDPPLDVKLTTIADWEEVDAEAILAASARLAAQHRFDLSLPPLMRATILILPGQRVFLLLTIHHIVVDGWSVAILEAELSGLLRSAALADRPAGADREMFDALIEQQQLDRRAPTYAHAFEARTAELASADPYLRFPSIPGRQIGHDANAERVPIAFDDVTTSQVAAAARRCRTTMFGMVLAAYSILLYKCSGQRAFLIGVPVSVRGPGTTDAVGLFVNLLPVATIVDRDTRVDDFIGVMRDRLLGALDRPLLSFEDLVHAVNPARTGDAHPLCQVAISWEEFGSTDADTSASGVGSMANLTRVTVPIVQSRFYIHLSLHRSGRGMAGEMVYRRDVLDKPAAEQMTACLEHLLIQLTERGEARVADLLLARECDLDSPDRLAPGARSSAADPSAVVDADGHPLPVGIPGFLDDRGSPSGRMENERTGSDMADPASTVGRARWLPDGRIEILAQPDDDLPSAVYTTQSDERASPELEAAVTATWVEVLSRASIGLDENFFALGGHSLLAIRLAARLRDRLGIAISPRIIYAAPTIRKMAGWVHGTTEVQVGR